MVYIKPYDSVTLHPIEFKIDTGADFTTISKEELYNIGYTDDWIDKYKQRHVGEVQIASGEIVESYDIPLPLFNVFGLEGENFPVGILMDRSIRPPTPLPMGVGSRVYVVPFMPVTVMAAFVLSLSTG